MFADTLLATRIEAGAGRMVVDCAEAIARRRPQAGVIVRRFSGGVAAHTGPDSPLNKVVGLGFGGELNVGELAEFERVCAQRKTPVLVEVSTLADPSVAAQLTRRGYVLIGFENVLGRRPATAAPASEPSGSIEVAVCAPAELAVWIDVMTRGFLAPDTQGIPSHESFPEDAMRQIQEDMAEARAFERFLARVDGVPAGGGALRIDDGIAGLCGAATLPQFRRRGVQTALTRARLARAAACGCDLVLVVTLPGSKSQQNAQRDGFELLYSRAVLSKDVAGVGA